MGILEQFRHLPVLTNPFFFFFFGDRDCSESFEDQDAKIHLAKSLGKEKQPSHGGISDGSLLTCILNVI